MLVMTRGNIVFSRRMTFAEDGIDIVETRDRRLWLDSLDFDLDFTTLG